MNNNKVRYLNISVSNSYLSVQANVGLQETLNFEEDKSKKNAQMTKSIQEVLSQTKKRYPSKHTTPEQSLDAVWLSKLLYLEYEYCLYQKY